MASHRTAMLRQLQSHLTPFPTAAEAEEPTFRELFTKFEHMIPMRDGEPLLPPLPRTHTARPFRFLLFPALAALPPLPSRPTPRPQPPQPLLAHVCRRRGQAAHDGLRPEARAGRHAAAADAHAHAALPLLRRTLR